MSEKVHTEFRSVNESETLLLEGREITFRNFSDLPVILNDGLTLPARYEVSTSVFWPYELTLSDLQAIDSKLWKITFAESATIKRLEIIIRR